MTKTHRDFIFSEGLALLFIALKLTGHIDWSWWWVLAPVYVPLIIVGLIFGTMLLKMHMR